MADIKTEEPPVDKVEDATEEKALVRDDDDAVSVHSFTTDSSASLLYGGHHPPPPPPFPVPHARRRRAKKRVFKVDGKVPEVLHVINYYGRYQNDIIDSKLVLQQKRLSPFCRSTY